MRFEINNNFPQNNNDIALIDIREVTNAIYQAKCLVLLITVLMTACAILVGWTISSYKSEGYFQMEMSFADFKRLKSALVAPSRWQDFTKTLNKSQLYTFQDEDFYANSKLESLITPIYPVTRSEIKDIPNAMLKNEGADISGLKLFYQAETPLLAQQGVLVLGDFLRDTMILLDVKEAVRKRFMEYQSRAQKLDNDTIEARYELEQLKLKRASMETILYKYPNAVRLENRQPVTITDGNERFLSPVTQLVAIETDIAEKTREMPKIFREQQINIIHLRYYKQLQDLISKSTSGNTFLAMLPTLKNQLKLNMDDEVERTVFNNISIDNLNARSLYIEKKSFIAPPLIPKKSTPGLLKSGLIGLLLGLIAGCGIALIRYFFAKPSLLQSHSNAEFMLEKTIPNLNQAQINLVQAINRIQK
ncbi:MAG: hypothetical protein H7240_12060 [Glaciimonas sp.]|nr:hypothetical protein [Glaciimonas sp.]